jgi:hypothetical protein
LYTHSDTISLTFTLFFFFFTKLPLSKIIKLCSFLQKLLTKTIYTCKLYTKQVSFLFLFFFLFMSFEDVCLKNMRGNWWHAFLPKTKLFLLAQMAINLRLLVIVLGSWSLHQANNHMSMQIKYIFSIPIAFSR